MRMNAARHLPGQVPVTPDDEQAQQWLRDELSKPAYDEARPGLVERALRALVDWLGDFLDSVGAASPLTGTLIIAALAVAVLLIVVFVVRPRLNASARPEGGVFDDAEPSAAVDHRRLAAAATQRGDFAEALTQWLRAVIRTAEERTLIDPVPGLTASEAGARLSTVFPAEAEGIAWLATRFNEIRYGSGTAAAEDASGAAALDARLRSAAPAHPAARAVAGLAVPR